MYIYTHGTWCSGAYMYYMMSNMYMLKKKIRYKLYTA